MKRKFWCFFSGVCCQRNQKKNLLGSVEGKNNLLEIKTVNCKTLKTAKLT